MPSGRTDAEIVRDHQKRYSVQRGLLAKAQASVTYWAKRAGSAHGREMLARAVARRATRRNNVATELKIIERHRHAAGVTSVSAEGLAFVAGQEGFRSKPYRDAVGVWTIGYGETRGVGPNTPALSRAGALAQLRARINADYLDPVLKFAHAHGLELRQAQADALASFAYNLGAGVFRLGTDIGNAVATGNRTKIANAILEYDKAGSPPRPLLGLTRRRQAERAMFLNAK